ncbi:hypothetical protein AVEN_271877-1 [Araneus ventricosus]|uniref:Uncharacterized protein n=1 Tax=Araneus ventricosus TaxID=182803 RepID=A0A4Y2P999_ARAVE|nr:hypothetical protein AVEN_7679-1 [Araneus ventricosus]GBN47579.1 hypothetical protein AVEN_96547-1 [Araneus ventricosus]GBN47603.1 hypothetical protein AVEN_43117-1 [Araneus ventricosus]GBN48345.1 hypothetical protein AVEN_271877-1 [Araneus ventricosus]
MNFLDHYVGFSAQQPNIIEIGFRTWNPPTPGARTLPPGLRGPSCSCKPHGIHRPLPSTLAFRLLLKPRSLSQSQKLCFIRMAHTTRFRHGPYYPIFAWHILPDFGMAHTTRFWHGPYYPTDIKKKNIVRAKVASKETRCNFQGII